MYVLPIQNLLAKNYVDYYNTSVLVSLLKIDRGNTLNHGIIRAYNQLCNLKFCGDKERSAPNTEKDTFNDYVRSLMNTKKDTLNDYVKYLGNTENIHSMYILFAEFNR